VSGTGHKDTIPLMGEKGKGGTDLKVLRASNAGEKGGKKKDRDPGVETRGVGSKSVLKKHKKNQKKLYARKQRQESQSAAPGASIDRVPVTKNNYQHQPLRKKGKMKPKKQIGPNL